METKEDSIQEAQIERVVKLLYKKLTDEDIKILDNYYANQELKALTEQNKKFEEMIEGFENVINRQKGDLDKEKLKIKLKELLQKLKEMGK